MRNKDPLYGSSLFLKLTGRNRSKAAGRDRGYERPLCGVTRWFGRLGLDGGIGHEQIS